MNMLLGGGGKSFTMRPYLSAQHHLATQVGLAVPIHLEPVLVPTRSVPLLAVTHSQHLVLVVLKHGQTPSAVLRAFPHQEHHLLIPGVLRSGTAPSSRCVAFMSLCSPWTLRSFPSVATPGHGLHECVPECTSSVGDCR